MFSSSHRPTMNFTNSQSEDAKTSLDLGFGDLCRYFYRALREDFEDYIAHNLATTMVECWKRNKYVFSDLEEMFLINMQQNQDKELLARELGSTLGDDRESLPEGVSCARLVNLTIEFFTTEPNMTDKLRKYREHMSKAEQAKRIVIGPGMKRGRSPSTNLDVEIRPKKKMSKFDSLKPIANYLESLFVSHGLTQHCADLVVLDIAERFVTAGFGWDKVLQYHAKGEDIFIKKLVPHVFMSKDDFPPSITSENVLKKTFEFMEDWKNKLYDMLSFSTINLMQSKKPAVAIKQEPVEQIPLELPQNVGQHFEYPFQPRQIDVKTEKQHGSVPWKPLLLGESKQSQSCSTANKMKDCLDIKGYSQEKKDINERDLSRVSNKKYKDEIDYERELSLSKSHSKKKNPKAIESQVQLVSRLRSLSPEGRRFNAKIKDYEKNLKKHEFNSPEMRDIDARHETVPNSHFSKHGLKDNERFLSLEDMDGKTTFYHYKENDKQSAKEKEMVASTKKKKKPNSTDKDPQGSFSSTSNEPVKEEILRSALKKRLANKVATPNENSPKKETDSDTSQDSHPEDKKISLLEKVNKIIKSCVMLKEEKNAAGIKASEIAGDTKEKENNAIRNSEGLDEIKEAKLEEGELNDSDQENEFENGKENDPQRTVTIVKKKNITRTEYDYNRSLLIKPDCKRSSSKSSQTSTSRSSLKTRSQTRSKTRSRSRPPQRSVSRGRSFSNTLQRKPRTTPRHRSWSRQRSLSPHYRRSRTRSSPRYTEYRKRRSRTPERMRRSEHWVPVSPCTIQENITLEKCSTMMVTVAPRGQFSFKENKGSMVRITKWTGRDYIGCIHIRPQIVTIDENMDLQIEVENPYPEKNIYLKKHDSIACLSILTSPIPSAMFSSVHSSAADKYENGSKRWFKVTSVVLHKKGRLDRITIQPGRTMKIIGTVLGPLKKYVGKEVLVSQMKDGKECPIRPQIRRICENDCIGFDVTNNGRETLVLEKDSQAVAYLSVWSTVRMEDDRSSARF